MPEKQELTTVEAANFLNVSRPFVIKEIKSVNSASHGRITSAGAAQ